MSGVDVYVTYNNKLSDYVDFHIIFNPSYKYLLAYRYHLHSTMQHDQSKSYLSKRQSSPFSFPYILSIISSRRETKFRTGLNLCACITEGTRVAGTRFARRVTRPAANCRSDRRDDAGFQRRTTHAQENSKIRVGKVGTKRLLLSWFCRIRAP